MKLLRRLSAAFAAVLFATALPCQTAPVATPQVAAKAATAIERPLLWRIELPTPSYLYGTIHLPDDRVTSLPPVVTEAMFLAKTTGRSGTLPPCSAACLA